METLETILKSQVGATMTLPATLVIVASALVLGLIVGLVYSAVQKKAGRDTSLAITLIMVPAIIAITVYLIGNNVARAFTLAGAFSLIRYRSNPASAKDIAYIFFSVAIGLACGMGFIAYGALFCIILCVVMLIISAAQFGEPTIDQMTLKITLPENIDYNGLFDELLKEYTTGARLLKVRTSEFGTMFELVYRIRIRDVKNTKPFIDEIRKLNGNLSVSLSAVVSEE